MTNEEIAEYTGLSIMEVEQLAGFKPYRLNRWILYLTDKEHYIM